MNARYPWTQAAVWSLALLLGLSLLALTACQKGQSPPTQGQQGQAQNQGNQGNQGDQAAKPPAAPPELVPITYTDADKEGIRNTAKFTGVATIYVPQKTVPGDQLNQVQGSGKVMTVKYNHMAVMESSDELQPAGLEPEKVVQLSIGTANWLTVGGQSGLYLKQGDTFVAIQPAKDVAPEAVEAIADSLAPLQ